MENEGLQKASEVGIDIERVLLSGDLAKLTPEQRLSYYKAVCDSVGLNPLTQPFQYLHLNGKTVLYAAKSCTDQLRSIHGVSVLELSESTVGDVFVVTAKVQNAKGRIDMAKGAVTLGSLRGDALANALMKCETKAKRRATLSICGLGILDETEIETIPNATTFDRDAYVEAKTAELKAPKPQPETAPTPKEEKELERWQRLTKVCKSAKDVNALLPKARLAPQEAKILLWEAAKRLGLRFDADSQEFMDGLEAGKGDFRIYEKPSEPPSDAQQESEPIQPSSPSPNAAGEATAAQQTAFPAAKAAKDAISTSELISQKVLVREVVKTKRGNREQVCLTCEIAGVDEYLELYCWHKATMFEALMNTRWKECVFGIARRERGDNVWYTIEEIDWIGPVQYANNKPLLSPTAEQMGFGG